MRIYDMTSDSAERLAELQSVLEEIDRRGLTTQARLGTMSGVHQTKVSLARRGKLKRWNDATDRLMSSCRAVVGESGRRTLGDSVIHEAHKFYANGGTDVELAAVIAHGTMLIGRLLTRGDNSPKDVR